MIIERVKDHQYTDEDDDNHFKIVFCNFAFKNRELLLMLQERANAVRELKTGDPENAEEFEAKV